SPSPSTSFPFPLPGSIFAYLELFQSNNIQRVLQYNPKEMMLSKTADIGNDSNILAERIVTIVVSSTNKVGQSSSRNSLDFFALFLLQSYLKKNSHPPPDIVFVNHHHHHPSSPPP